MIQRDSNQKWNNINDKTHSNYIHMKLDQPFFVCIALCTLEKLPQVHKSPRWHTTPSSIYNILIDIGYQ